MNLTETRPAFLFDFNGVLVDDERVHLAAFQQVLLPLGVALDEKAYWDRYLGFDDVGATTQMLRDAGRMSTPEQIEKIVVLKAAAYAERAREALPVFEGAASLVADAARRGTVGIVSGALKQEIDLGLQVLGVKHLVSFIVAAEDTRLCKPDPEGYLLALDRLRSLNRESAGDGAVVIEDSVAGVQAAKSARLVCAAVGHSYSASELRQAGADLVVEHIRLLDAGRLAALCRGGGVG